MWFVAKIRFYFAWVLNLDYIKLNPKIVGRKFHICSRFQNLAKFDWTKTISVLIVRFRSDKNIINLLKLTDCVTYCFYFFCWQWTAFFSSLLVLLKFKYLPFAFHIRMHGTFSKIRCRDYNFGVFFSLLLLFITKLVFSLSSSQYDQSCTFKCKINWFNCQQTELEQKNDEKVISVVIFCDFANVALFFHFSVRNISFHLLRSFYTFSNFCLYWIIILEFHCTLFIQLETRSQRPQREKNTHTHFFVNLFFIKRINELNAKKGVKCIAVPFSFRKII